MNYMTRGQHDAVMTFREIGERMGISADNAHNHFERGMKKLRKHPDVARKLADMIAFAKRERTGIVPRQHTAQIRPLAVMTRFSEMEERL